MAIETLNGAAPSWSNAAIVFNVDGAAPLDDADVKGLNFEEAIERGEMRGQGGGLKKYTDGMATPTASMTLYQEGARVFKRALMAAAIAGNLVDSAGRPQLSKVSFDIIVKHSIDGDPEIYIHTIIGCKLGKDARALAEGVDANVAEMDLHPLKIVEVIDGTDTVLL
jgi:hypothetical protein